MLYRDERVFGFLRLAHPIPQLCGYVFFGVIGVAVLLIVVGQ